MLKIRTLWLAAAGLVTSASIAGAVAQLSRPTIGSGAGLATAAGHTIGLTVGQPVIGTAQAAAHQVSSGFWQPSGQTSTDVPEGPPALVPMAFSLHQNTPNPFNPRTSIQFDLPKPAARVALRVYDVSGRLVATLADAPFAAGRHSIVWNGDDDHGRGVASGVYIYVLDTPDHHDTKKLALVR